MTMERKARSPSVGYASRPLRHNESLDGDVSGPPKKTRCVCLGAQMNILFSD